MVIESIIFSFKKNIYIYCDTFKWATFLSVYPRQNAKMCVLKKHSIHQFLIPGSQQVSFWLPDLDSIE
jgi:hypothetical protein